MPPRNLVAIDSSGSTGAGTSTYWRKVARLLASIDAGGPEETLVLFWSSAGAANHLSLLSVAEARAKVATISGGGTSVSEVGESRAPLRPARRCVPRAAATREPSPVLR
jgi:hypothetical protein